MHVLKIWKDFEFIKHTVSKYWSVKETCARNEKKMCRQAQTKYLKLNTEHKQSSKRKKKWNLYLPNFWLLLPNFYFWKGVWLRGNDPSIQLWGFPNIFFFSKILRFKLISKSWGKFYTTFFILDIKFVLRCSKALQYYDQDCLKTFLLLSTSLTMIQVFENIPILAQKITFSWKTRQIWKLLNVTFWPKPNMRNSAYTNKTLNLEILLNLIALYMYWRFQKALNL